jgi:dsDNA-specific endonuclease/ATPase MutS2
LSLKPADGLEFIDNEQQLVSEMKLLLNTEGFLSFEGLIDVDPIVKASHAEGSRLDPEKILAVLRIAESSRQSKRYTLSRQPLYPRLHHLTKDMPPFEGLTESIMQAISPDGQIRDSASPELKICKWG